MDQNSRRSKGVGDLSPDPPQFVYDEEECKDVFLSACNTATTKWMERFEFEIYYKIYPKYIMANGALVRVLIHTDVTKYLYFKAVDGSFVYNKGKVHKVPATDMEALKSPLMGIFEKRRARKFFIYVQDYNESDPKKHEGMDLTRVTTRELIATFNSQK